MAPTTRAAILPLLVLATNAPAADVVPYPIHKRTLSNGLDVLVVEMPEFRHVLSFNVLVLAGSRNEMEKGKTGLAHLFEHIAFRHRFEDPERSYDARIEKLGAFDNAWTWFDVTFYHPVTFVENIEPLIALQAERFVSMDFSEKIYRTEAGAVLGEYRRIASDPSQRIDEVLSDLAYGSAHGYGHTTLGYLDDIQKMPDTYEAGRAFYETYYRPNNSVVIVAGDVRAESTFAIVEKSFGPWEPREVPQLPEPGPLGGPKRGHIEWESRVAPRLVYAHRVPAFRPGEKESAVLSVLAELATGRTSPLFRRLRYEKQVAVAVFTEERGAQGFHPRLLETTVRLEPTRFESRGKDLFEEVERDLGEAYEALQGFSARPDARSTLESIKSRHRYDLMASLDSPHSLAGTLAWYYRFDRRPDVLSRVVETVAGLVPEDVDAFARRHLVPENRVVVTMAPGVPPAEADGGAKGAAE